MDRKMLVAMIVFSGIAVTLIAFVIYFLVARSNKKKQDANGQVLVQVVSPVSSSQFALKQFVSGNQDNSAWSYAAVMKIGRFQAEADNIVMMTRGDSGNRLLDQRMLVIMDGSSSSMYVAFRNLKPASAIASDTRYFVPYSYNKNDSETLKGLINQYFCIFKVVDIPYFRFFALHILWDFNSGVAKIFVDGKITQVCSLYECSDDGLDTHLGDTVSIGYKLPGVVSSDNTLNSLSAYNGIEFRYLKVSNMIMSLDEIRAGSEKIVNDVYKQIAQEARNLDTCELD